MPETSGSSLSGASLSGLALERLTAMILTCELAPGDWVTEKQLAVLTGLGLAPVRAAAARLRHDGLLIAVPRVGYQVAPITLEDALDLFDVWSVVGGAIVERAAQRATAAEIEVYEAQEQALVEQVQAGTLSVVEMAARSFEMVVDMAHSKRLKALFEKFRVDLGRSLSVATQGREEMQSAVLDVETLATAMHARDGTGAVASFSVFVRMMRDIVVEVLQSSPGIVDAPLRLPARLS